MKWVAMIAGAAALVYLFKTEKGKALLGSVKELGKQAGDLKRYMGNIVHDVKEEKLQYGEDPQPVAAR